jgi:HTH-type transcriptional regulator / antitoxin HigA
MVGVMTYRTPAEAFPPGDFLREELEVRGWTQTELAKMIGRPARLINEIIAAKRAITPETAMDLAAAFGTSAQYWLSLESSYQLFKAALGADRRARDEAISREARLREKYPIRELAKRGWVTPSENIDVTESRVLQFYNIKSLNDVPMLAHAAKRDYSEELSALQLAWLFRVKHLAGALHTPAYSEKKLRSSLADLESLLSSPEEIRHAPRVLTECGVRLVIVEPVAGSKIDGVCFWIEGKIPVIGLTLRLDRLDNAWFVIRHEIEHVLRGDGKQSPIVDETSDNGDLTSDAGDDVEGAANRAAADFCVPAGDLSNFIARVDPLYSEKKILGFANRMKRHPSLVVGQLHHKTGRYEMLRRHLVKCRGLIVGEALTDGYGFAGPNDLGVL